MCRTSIPSAALLGLSFTACGEEAIVGTWGAVQVNDVGYPIVQMDDDRHTTAQIELVIEDDLTGALITRQVTEFAGGEELYELSFDARISARGDGTYALEVQQPAGYDSGYDTGYYGDYAGDDVDFRGFAVPGDTVKVELDCVLADSELTCTTDDEDKDKYRFKKR